MRDLPKCGEFYRDFQRRPYQIVSVAEHQLTGELLVIYQALYDEFKVYAGTPDSFLSEEEYAKYSDAARKYRFEKMTIGEKTSERAALEKPLFQEEAFLRPQAAAAERQAGSNDKMMEFFDTDDFDTRYNILVSMRDSITDTQINNMAVVLDVVIPEGDLDDRYEQLKTCLRTRQRYESCRLR